MPSRLIAPRRVHTGALDFPSGNDGHVELLDSSTIAKYGTGNSLGTAIMLVEGGHSLVSARALRLNNSSTFSKQIFMSGAGNDEPTFAVNKTTGDLSISATWSTMGISDGEWVWLAYVFDTAGANADQLMYFARPGEKLREPSSYATQTAGSGTLISDSGHTFYIGNRWGGGGPYGRRMAWFAWADIEWRFDEISRFIRNPWHGGPRCILNLPLYGSGKADDLVRDISGTANHAKFATTSTDYPVPEVGYPLVESRAYPLRVTPPSVDRDPIPFVRERGVHRNALDFPDSSDAVVDIGDDAGQQGVDSGTWMVLSRLHTASGVTDDRMFRRDSSSASRTSLITGGAGYGDNKMHLTFDVTRATLSCAATSNFENWGLAEDPQEWMWAAARFDTGGADADQKLWLARLNGALTEPSSYETQRVGSGTPEADTSGFATRIGNRQNGLTPYRDSVAWLMQSTEMLTVSEMHAFIRDPWRSPRGCVLNIALGGRGVQVDLSGNGRHGVLGGTTEPNPSAGPIVRGIPLRLAVPGPHFAPALIRR